MLEESKVRQGSNSSLYEINPDEIIGNLSAEGQRQFRLKYSDIRDAGAQEFYKYAYAFLVKIFLQYNVSEGNKPNLTGTQQGILQRVRAANSYGSPSDSVVISIGNGNDSALKEFVGRVLNKKPSSNGSFTLERASFMNNFPDLVSSRTARKKPVLDKSEPSMSQETPKEMQGMLEAEILLEQIDSLVSDYKSNENQEGQEIKEEIEILESNLAQLESQNAEAISSIVANNAVNLKQQREQHLRRRYMSTIGSKIDNNWENNEDDVGVGQDIKISTMTDNFINKLVFSFELFDLDINKRIGSIGILNDLIDLSEKNENSNEYKAKLKALVKKYGLNDSAERKERSEKKFKTLAISLKAMRENDRERYSKFINKANNFKFLDLNKEDKDFEALSDDEQDFLLDCSESYTTMIAKKNKKMGKAIGWIMFILGIGASIAAVGLTFGLFAPAIVPAVALGLKIFGLTVGPLFGINRFKTAVVYLRNFFGGQEHFTANNGKLRQMNKVLQPENNKVLKSQIDSRSLEIDQLKTQLQRLKMKHMELKGGNGAIRAHIQKDIRAKIGKLQALAKSSKDLVQKANKNIVGRVVDNIGKLGSDLQDSLKSVFSSKAIAERESSIIGKLNGLGITAVNDSSGPINSGRNAVQAATERRELVGPSVRST